MQHPNCFPEKCKLALLHCCLRPGFLSPSIVRFSETCLIWNEPYCMAQIFGIAVLENVVQECGKQQENENNLVLSKSLHHNVMVVKNFPTNLSLS